MKSLVLAVLLVLLAIGLSPLKTVDAYPQIDVAVTPDNPAPQTTVSLGACGFQSNTDSVTVKEYIEQPSGSYMLFRERSLKVVDHCLAPEGNHWPIPNVPSVRFDVLVDGEVVGSETVSVQQA